MRPAMKLQMKIGQCVADVLDDVNLKTDEEVGAWVKASVARAGLTIRQAEKASRKARAS